MINSLYQFHFLRPGWLLLLPLLILLGLVAYWRTKNKTQWQDMVDPHLLCYLLDHDKQQRIPWSLWLLACAWLLSTLALAGPAWRMRAMPVLRSDHAITIAVDMSQAMLAQDVKPNRAQQAKFKIRDIMTHLSSADIGLLAFSDAAYMVSPLTQDPATILALLPELNPHMMPTTGCNIANALTQAAQMIHHSGQTHGFILLLTANKATPTDINMARHLSQQGMQISVLGIGTRTGAPIPNYEAGFSHDATGKITISQLAIPSLQRLAAAGKGQYHSLTSDQTDITVLLNGMQQYIEQWHHSSQLSKQWVDEGLWLLFPIVIILSLTFRKRWSLPNSL